jgi:steroid delta-isomerase-like uncharacterized protein
MASAEQETQTAEQVARSYFKAIGARDLEAAVGHWHPDGVEDVVPLRVYRGSAEIRSFLRSLMEAMPDLEMVPSRVTAGDRVAVVEWRMTGTFNGAQFEGIDPTGAHMESRGADCLEVEDGLLVRNTAYYDGAEFARAIGLMPRRDSGAERALTTAFNGATRVRTLVREQLDR